MLKIENLTVKYPDGKLAVDNFSLSVESGKKVALVGTNGAGKSTLMLAIEGLLEGEGSIFVDGMVLNKENLADIRQRVEWSFKIRMTSCLWQIFMTTLPLVPEIWA